MDKLELKHLAPYLPYGLKLNTLENEMYLIDFKNKKIESTFRGHLINIYEWDEVKPILRPIADFDDPKKYTGDHYSYMSELNIEMPNDLQIDRDLEFDIERNCFVHCKYAMQVYDFLFANHFDVFDLIDKGLAVDINTLTDV